MKKRHGYIALMDYLSKHYFKRTYYAIASEGMQPVSKDQEEWLVMKWSKECFSHECMSLERFKHDFKLRMKLLWPPKELV